jgi:mono/diheme cytochrome c family protein
MAGIKMKLASLQRRNALHRWTIRTSCCLLLGIASGWLPLDHLVSQSLGKTGRTFSQAGANPEAGRRIFNGKGICHYCHGIDGNRENRTQLEPSTADFIQGLQPQPPDLRNPKGLRLKQDAARAKLIKEGHVGTGMFPDARMTQQELADILAYLAVLRHEDRRPS